MFTISFSPAPSGPLIHHLHRITSRTQGEKKIRELVRLKCMVPGPHSYHSISQNLKTASNWPLFYQRCTSQTAFSKMVPYWFLTKSLIFHSLLQIKHMHMWACPHTHSHTPWLSLGILSCGDFRFLDFAFRPPVLILSLIFEQHLA